MSSFRSLLYRQRRLFLGLSGLALVVGLLGGLAIGVSRLVHHVWAFYEVVGLVVAAGLVATILCAKIGRSVPARAVIELDLSTTLPPERLGGGPLDAVRGGTKPLTLRETVEALERAGEDRRVEGLLVNSGFNAAGMAQIQEVRDAIRAFRAKGKFAVAFADTFENGSYYLATACDEIVLQPSGEVGLVGLARDVTFIRGALDRLGIEPLFEGRHEYKSAASQLLSTEMSDPERQQMQRILDSHFSQIVNGIADARGSSPEEVRAIADRGPFLAEEARDIGLVDRLAYRDEAVARAKERAGNDSALLFLSRYAKRARRKSGKGKPTTVALITATGDITRTAGRTSPLRSGGIAADKVAGLIRAAVKDKRIKAILLRVDSPGGSAVASDTIWRETVLAREAGKPVIVSMGDVAASGGYYIAAAADRIVAQPGTITGSIGVIAGKPVIAEAKRKLGLTVDEVHTSEHARLFSFNRGFSASEHERFARSLDGIYDDFVSKVASGRSLPKSRVDEIARGRVWTGEDAKEIGLVDALGGFPTALGLVREVVGVDASAPVRLRILPKKTSMLASVRGGGATGESSDDQRAARAALTAAAEVLGAVAPMVSLARRAGLLAARGEVHLGSDAEDWMV